MPGPGSRSPIRQRRSTRGEKATSKPKTIVISGPDTVTAGRWATDDLVARRDALMEERRKAGLLRRRDELMAAERRRRAAKPPGASRPSGRRGSRDTSQ